MINRNLALLFHDDYVKAAISPFPNQLEMLDSANYHLYFLQNHGKISFGNYKLNSELVCDACFSNVSRTNGWTRLLSAFILLG